MTFKNALLTGNLRIFCYCSNNGLVLAIKKQKTVYFFYSEGAVFLTIELKRLFEILKLYDIKNKKMMQKKIDKITKIFIFETDFSNYSLCKRKKVFYTQFKKDFQDTVIFKDFYIKEINV